MNKLPQRKPNRLKDYDYSHNGYYFITICTKDKRELFWDGESVGAAIGRPHPPLSDIGKAVNDAIENIPRIYESITIDKYVIMPNHVHLILIITNDGGRAMRAPTISTVINQMKGYASKQAGCLIWQKLFHDHVVRNKADYARIWSYIDENPINWQDDCFYPK